jgi:hypothetical protein
MWPTLIALFGTICTSIRTRADLEAEILALRHELAVLQQQAAGQRLRLSRADRLLWVLFARVWAGWRRTIRIV